VTCQRAVWHTYERRNKRRKRDLLLVHWQPMLKLGINKRNHRIWNIFFLTTIKSDMHIFNVKKSLTYIHIIYMYQVKQKEKQE
jgi:hypothetical protein